MDEPQFPRDHNLPPSPRQAALSELEFRLSRYVARVEELRAGMNKFVTIRDRIDAGAAADLLGITKSVLELITGDQREVARPYDEAVGATRAKAENFTAELLVAAASLRERADEWAKGEDERIRQQEKEQADFERQRRQEIAARAAPSRAEPPAPEPVHIQAPSAKPKRRTVQGDLGASLTIGTDYLIAISDWKLLPDFVFQAEPVQQAIRAVVMPLVRKKVPIPGTVVTETAKTTARRR